MDTDNRMNRWESLDLLSDLQDSLSTTRSLCEQLAYHGTLSVHERSLAVSSYQGLDDMTVVFSPSLTRWQEYLF